MPHPFRHDMRDQFGRAWCTCGLPQANRVHEMPDPPPDAATRAAGEHDEDDEGE